MIGLRGRGTSLDSLCVILFSIEVLMDSTCLCFKFLLYLWYVCVWGGTHVPCHECGSQRTIRGLLPSSTLWVPGTTSGCKAWWQASLPTGASAGLWTWFSTFRILFLPQASITNSLMVQGLSSMRKAGAWAILLSLFWWEEWWWFPLRLGSFLLSADL